MTDLDLRGDPARPHRDGVSTNGHGPTGGAGTTWDRSAPAGRLLDGLDDAIDRAFDRLRQKPAADTVALVVSNLADYGFVWTVLAAFKARRPGPSRRRAIAGLALAGVASATVNTAVKGVVRRRRPEGAHDGPDGALLPVRRPSSSSFPSGHTLAACCTAVVLPEGTGGVAGALSFAAAVAASRVHLRAHHASDVLGGVVIGTAVGLAVRQLVPAHGRESPGPPRR